MPQKKVKARKRKKDDPQDDIYEQIKKSKLEKELANIDLDKELDSIDVVEPLIENNEEAE